MRERDREVLHEILEARGGFGHREHLELAWSYLRMYDNHEASEVMVGAIRRVARLHQAEDMYHETITRAWLHLVAVHIQRWGPSPAAGAGVVPRWFLRWQWPTIGWRDRVLCLAGVSRGLAGAFG